MKKVIKKKSVGRRKNNFVYDSFIKSFIFIRENKFYFIAPILLIFIAVIIGYFNLIGILFPNLGDLINQMVTKSVEQIVQETSGLGPVQLTGFIIFNNIKTAFLGAISGIYLAVYPILIVIFNGYVLGFVAEKAVNSPLNGEGIFVLWRLLPHGIFEIPAILISIGIGIKAGLFPFQVKNKLRGFLAFVVMLVIFLILSSVSMFVLSLFSKASDFTSIISNPIISLIFSILTLFSIIASVLIGLRILDEKDRKLVLDIIKNCFKVFIFVVVPLLVIAGIIEGLLIWIVG